MGIYIIGFGTEAGAPIPIEANGKVTMLEYKDEQVITQYDDASLRAVVEGLDAPEVVQLELSSSVGFAFAAPPIRIPTRAARAALPATVPHGVAVGGLARMA